METTLPQVTSNTLRTGSVTTPGRIPNLPTLPTIPGLGSSALRLPTMPTFGNTTTPTPTNLPMIPNVPTPAPMTPTQNTTDQGLFQGNALGATLNLPPRQPTLPTVDLTRVTSPNRFPLPVSSPLPITTGQPQTPQRQQPQLPQPMQQGNQGFQLPQLPQPMQQGMNTPNMGNFTLTQQGLGQQQPRLPLPQLPQTTQFNQNNQQQQQQQGFQQRPLFSQNVQQPQQGFGQGQQTPVRLQIRAPVQQPNQPPPMALPMQTDLSTLNQVRSVDQVEEINPSAVFQQRRVAGGQLQAYQPQLAPLTGGALTTPSRPMTGLQPLSGFQGLRQPGAVTQGLRTAQLPSGGRRVNNPVVTPSMAMSIELPRFNTTLPQTQAPPFIIGNQQGGLMMNQGYAIAQATPQQVEAMGHIDINRIKGERATKNDNSYSIEELRTIAKDLGLKSSGTKRDLAERILTHLRTMSR